MAAGRGDTGDTGDTVSAADLAGEGGGGWRGRAAYAALALAIYAAATTALLGPIARAPAEVLASADGSGDSALFAWNLWWVRQVLAGGVPGVEGQSLLHTRMLFWPEGTSLALHTLAPTLGVAAAPLQWPWPGTPGLVRALNLLVGLSFVLTGGAALLLARQAGASRAAALGAGLLALLQPYRLHHLNHLNLLSLQFGLLALWWLVRVLRHGRWRDAAGLAVTSLLASGTDLEAAVHVALAAALLVGWDLWAAWRRGALPARRPALQALGLGAALALLLHLPLLLALRSAGPVVSPPPGAAGLLSANLAGFALPGPASLLHGPARALHLVPPPGHGIVGDEVFLGVAFLGALALLLLRGRRGAGAWLLVGGALLALSLGPGLHAGALDAPGVALPWAWLGRAFPPLALSRSPVRLVHLGGIALTVALAVLASRAPAAPPGRAGSGRWRAAGLVALLLLLVAERWPARPVPVERVAIPEAYRRLAAEPGARAVLQSPEDDYVAWMHYLLWQTVHGKPMVLGYVSRAPEGTGRWLREVRALPPPARAARLREAGVGWLVVHPPGPFDPAREPRVVPLAPAAE